MPTYSGVWNLVAQFQAVGQGLWPSPPAYAFNAGGSQINTSTEINVISYVNIATLGNSADFGDLIFALYDAGSTSSATRGLVFGGTGFSISTLNVIQYITMASLGNAVDFGDLSLACTYSAGVSNGVTGVIALGNPTTGLSNVIESVTIASAGNATDFGDLTIAREGSGSVNSPTRGVFVAGNASGTTNDNVIDYVTIASAGNAIDFGDVLQVTMYQTGGCSSSTRGVFHVGTNSVIVNVIEYITIASTGNSTDFGDLTQTRTWLSATSSTIRGLFMGGATTNSAAANVNTIDYITIATIGNATDFGDLLAPLQRTTAFSNAHGGL